MDELRGGLALVPQQIRDSLPRTPACVDVVCRVKLYAPWDSGEHAGWRWYVISVDYRDDNLAECYVEGWFNESGTVAIDTIASLRGPNGEGVIRNKTYDYRSPEPESLGECNEYERYEYWQIATQDDAELFVSDDYCNEEILLVAASCSPEPAVMEILCNAKKNDVNHVGEGDRSALHLAVLFNHNPAIVNTLVRCGADVNAVDDDGRTPLHDAAEFALDPRVLRHLIQAGADVNAGTSWSEISPIQLALRAGSSAEVIRTLIEAGADVNQTDSFGSTPLDYCSTGGTSGQTVHLLLEAGAVHGSDTT